LQHIFQVPIATIFPMAGELNYHLPMDVFTNEQ
jgi:hypothetical protein